MIKNLKIYSLALLLAGIFIGCGSSGDTDSSTSTTTKNVSQDLSNFSDAEKLAYAIANQNKALSKGKQKKKRSRILQSCQNGGTMNMDVNVSDYSHPVTTVTYDNCLEDGDITNGSLKFEGDENNGQITYLTNFTYSGEDEVSVKPGSVKFIDEGNWKKMIINVEITVNGVTRAGHNLIYKGKELSDGSSIEFPVSGKEKIGDSSFFTVDTSYDASKTPFKSNANDELLSGLFKYKDDKSHMVELKVTAKEEISVKVDENGDGSFSADEKSKILLSK